MNQVEPSSQYVTFCIGDLYFGIDVLQVEEVLRFQPITRVPLAPDAIAGLINLRGQIVTVLDMRRCLGLPPQVEGMMPMNAVIHTDEGAVSLLVDAIGDVVDVQAAEFEHVPGNMNPAIREILRGVYKLKERFLLILDTAKTMDLA
jgi:purine-binding chemotaxis protein CheW